MNCINFFGRYSSIAFTIIFSLVLTSGISQLTFEQSFTPATIGPGGTTTLTFKITNNFSTTTTENLAFTNTLPPELMIASLANGSTTCSSGLLGAPANGSSITFSNGRLGALKSCSIKVNVTSSTVGGPYTNTTGDLTSNISNHGTSAAELTVDGNRPGFSKSFSPSTISPGASSRLVFTIDNTANNSDLRSIGFVDNFPGNLIVASPSNATTTCTLGQGSWNPTPGAHGVGVSGTALSVVDAGQSCTLQVDVTSPTSSSFRNISQELFSSITFNAADLSSGIAVADLNVKNQVLTKSFTDDPVAPGASVILQFTLNNLDAINSGREGFGDFENMTFTDDLEDVLPGYDLIFDNPVSNTCGGNLTGMGTDLISFDGGTLTPGQSCKIRVSLSIDTNAPTGSYLNTSSPISYTVGGVPVSGNTASDNLVLRSDPILTKEFLDATTETPNPVVAGGEDVLLRFTIQNTSPLNTASNISFVDDLTKILPFPIVASSVTPNPPCGAGSSFTLISLATERQGLALTGGELAGGDNCSFDVTLTLPIDITQGEYTNTTEEIFATVNNEQVTGKPATDVLLVATAPSLVKVFSANQVAPGDQVDLTFTFEHGNNAPGPASSIQFTDDLGSLISGLATDGNLNTGTCNGTLTESVTGVLSYSGGSLPIDGDCSFTLTLNVPANAPSGQYTNVTSDVTAIVTAGGGNVNVINVPSSDVLEVLSLTLDKEFINDPVLPGNATTLRFTIQNETNEAITNIAFTDDLDDVISGMTASGLPANDVCGLGSQLVASAGNSFLNFSGGNIPANGSCTFDVTVNVPPGAQEAEYGNLTSVVTADVNGQPVTAPSAEAGLLVSAPNLLTIGKTFTPSQAEQGSVVSIDFDISFEGGATATNISFTDDLDAALSGLVATGLPASVCNGGTISGSSVISMTGGSLATGTSCAFSVSVTIPANASVGSYTNTTGIVTADNISGNSASANLQVLQSSAELRAPTADAGPDQLNVECGAAVTLDGSGSTSFNNLPLTYIWTENGNQIATGVNPTVIFATGVHLITLTVSDANGSASDIVIVLASDTAPPSITCPQEAVICEGEPNILGSPIVNDTCDPNPTVTNNAPAVYTLNPTVVTWYVTDASGNIDSCMQNVVFVDNPTVSIASAELAPFCQGASLVLTATPSTSGTFLWSTNETTASIEINASGTYDVEFTDANGCKGTDQITVNVVPEDLLSAYTIISTSEEVNLKKFNTVLNGGVGVMNASKKAKIEDNTNISSSSTFVKANTIEITGGSTVTNQIIGVPAIVVPPFVPYSASGGSEVKVLQNQSVTLGASVYKKVELEKNATVTFTSSDLSIEEFKAGETATIIFNQCTEVKIKKGFALDKFANVNPTMMSVTVYAEKADIKEGSTIIADIYTSSELKAKGSAISPTSMKGLFIGNKVVGDDRVTWDWNTNCACNTSGQIQSEDEFILSANIIEEVTQAEIIEIDLFVSPNPFDQSFKLEGILPQHESTSTIIVTNLHQQEVLRTVVQKKELNETINTSEWASGVYFITVISESQRKTIKLIKTN